MSQRAYQLQSFCSADTEMYLHRAQREHCSRHSSLAAFRSSVCSSGHAPLEPPRQLPPYRVAPQWPSIVVVPGTRSTYAVQPGAVLATLTRLPSPHFCGGPRCES